MASHQIVSHVVPFPQIHEAEISQQDLVDFIEAQNTLTKLKKHVDGLEASVLARLQAGAVVEDGVHCAEVKKNSRRSPAWKDIVRRLSQRLGLDPDAYVSNVISHTKPSISYSLEIR
jgi:hypothetical protein